MTKAAGIVTNRGGAERVTRPSSVVRSAFPVLSGPSERPRSSPPVRLSPSVVLGERSEKYTRVDESSRTKVSICPAWPGLAPRSCSTLAIPSRRSRCHFSPTMGSGWLAWNSSFPVRSAFTRSAAPFRSTFRGASQRKDRSSDAVLPKTRGVFRRQAGRGSRANRCGFYPKDVIIRMSDFKTNEYAHLLGGEDFEPKEENPMIGFRGASRYYDDRYRDGFLLECRAMKRSAKKWGSSISS